ncbi:MAG: hypothetical protein HY703_03755 [Gemmatimonadetes bacterium]|nr:hypothetical protein [Gemmatimonadota bacterium]
MTEREFFQRKWDEELPITARVFRAAPADQLEWRPHARSRSARELLAVMSEEVRMAGDFVDHGACDWVEPSGAGQGLDQFLGTLEAGGAALKERLARLDDAAWARPVALKMGAQVVFECPLGEMLWGTLLDVIHHRGQLSTYLRPMGGKVPSIYGPSADEMTPASDQVAASG